MPACAPTKLIVNVCVVDVVVSVTAMSVKP